MQKNRLIQILFLLTPSFSYAVEYLCWQVNDTFPAMAYEASTTNCESGKKESGSVEGTPKEKKKIVCLATATCLALTNDLIDVLKRKTNLTTLDKIKELSGISIGDALLGTPYIGRASQVNCEGTGTTKIDMNGKLNLVEAECPNITSCANSSEVLYGIMMGASTIRQPFKRPQGSAPARIVPNTGAN